MSPKLLLIGATLLCHFWSSGALAAPGEWICQAYCTKFISGHLANTSVQKYYGTQLMSAYSSTATKALDQLKQSCRKQTPSDFSVSVDMIVYIKKVYGIDLISDQSVYATTGNSCHQL